MCGIAGLFSKSGLIDEQLGSHLGRMISQLADRGPDSAGVALYRDPAPPGTRKVSLYSPDPDCSWSPLAGELGAAFGGAHEPETRASHALIVVEAGADSIRDWFAAHHPELRIMSIGERIEIFKEKGDPRTFARRFELDSISASHALAHTRMATESRVSTEHSHPFASGLDVCLVHNGSLSNHNRLRLELQREGIHFDTDNDSEVAARYLSWRLHQGATLTAALERSLDDLDGFFTFAVGTAGGLAVLRDPIACKPAVLAETDDWVAIGSEYRALAVLPGAADAEPWEPEPGRVYSWERAPAV